MVKPILLTWVTWKNRDILTLECSDDRIRSPRLIVYRKGERDPYVQTKSSNGDKTKALIASHLLWMTRYNSKSRVNVKDVAFFHRGIDVTYHSNEGDRFDAMANIDRAIRDALSEFEIEFNLPSSSR